MSIEDVTLTVAGKPYNGWKEFSYSDSLEAMHADFELQVSERWAGQSTRREIRTSQSCLLFYKGNILLNGYVDDVDSDYDASTHTVSVRGRDRTADLVDCSAIHETGEFKDQDFKQIAELLCAPFDIIVYIGAGVDIGAKFTKIAINDGESVFEFMERMARHRGLLLNKTPNGNVRIDSPSLKTLKTELILGVNVKSASAKNSVRERYNTYLVKAQTAGDDGWNTEQAAEPTAQSTDNGARPERTKLILAEEQADNAECQIRADWQRNVNIGRARTITYTVQGWEYEDGKVWPVNRNVLVTDEYLNLNRKKFLIVARKFTKSSQGTTTQLTLAPRQAYTLLPVPEPDAGALW